MERHHFKFKRVMRYDRRSRMIRLFRIIWQRGRVGDGKGYSVKLSLALRPVLFSFRREFGEWLLTLAGIRIHYQRSYGGIQV